MPRTVSRKILPSFHYSLVPYDHLGAPVGAPDEVADEVRHGAGGHEEGGLLAQQLRRLGLQPLHRRVLPENVVANLGLIWLVGRAIRAANQVRASAGGDLLINGGGRGGEREETCD